MEVNIKRINYLEACEISKWTYKYCYYIYGMDQSAKSISKLRNRSYFSVTDKQNNLLGYYCFGKYAQVQAAKRFGVYDDKNFTDIGLALRPNLCCKGLGFDFINNGLKFARNHFYAKDFRLTVASFNKRAIKVYERIGFRKVNSFKIISRLGKIEFWVMVLSDTQNL